VASGSPLPDEALSPRQVGHAIEARLYAEDPVHEFLPVTGTINRFEFPDRTGLRVDSGVTSGDSVSVFYDPMLAKVIAWAETRDEAAALLAHSLQRAELHGPTTNRELLVRILRHPEFVAGATDTHFLERHNPATLGAPLPDQAGEQLAALAAALAAQSERRASAVLQKSIPSGWRNSPSQPQRFVYQGYHGQHSIAYRFDRAGLTVVLPGAEPRPARIHQVTPVRIGLELDGHLRWYRINRVEDVIHVDGPTGYSRLKELPRFPPPTVDDDPGSLHAPMPGTVVRVLVEVGNEVLEGQAMVVLEAMKMEHTLRAPHDGIVKDVRAEAGQQVEADRILVVLEPR
jgi:acetyl/propionyl-CoA carboxylase alpha subunit